MLGSQASTATCFSAAVSSFLPELVSALLRAKVRCTPSGKQGQGSSTRSPGQALRAGESVTGLSKIQLLRACLSLLAKKRREAD